MTKRIIIENTKDWVLQVRAARSAIDGGIKVGDVWGIGFAGGSHYGVKCNKDSVRVYPQQRDEA